MKSLHRPIYTIIFLFAILIQLLIPLYPVHAVAGAAGGAAAGAGACAIGTIGGVAGGAISAIVDQLTGFPVADKAAVLMLAAIEGTLIPTCVASATTAGVQVQETFIQHVLNALFYAAINMILQTITNQIIGWIKGTDSNFIQNLKSQFVRTADAEVGGLLVDLTGVNLCGNIGVFLKLAIGVPTASIRQRLQCSVTGIIGNFENFYQNFANGGWPAFFQISLEPQNNAYGAFLLSMNEQFQRQNGAQVALQQRLIEGSGFLGFNNPRDANCRTVNGEKATEARRFIEIQKQAGGERTRKVTEVAADPGVEPQYEVCDIEYDTKTPGSLFTAALPAATFSGLRRAELANNIDQAIGQIVFALLQRIMQASMGNGKGIFGSSDIGTPPRSTIIDGGFNLALITNPADDTVLRLEAVEVVLDAKIQDLDRQISVINTQIAALQASCATSSSTCDQAQLDQLTTQRTSLEQDRGVQIALLTRAHSDLAQILDLRARILTTTDAALLTNLAERLNTLEADAEDIIQQAGGPLPGQNGTDPTDNFVRIITRAQERTTAFIPFLNTKIAGETDPTKKAALTAARDELKNLSADLTALRTAFLNAIANQTSTAGIMTQITRTIGAINNKIASIYSL